MQGTRRPGSRPSDVPHLGKVEDGDGGLDQKPLLSDGLEGPGGPAARCSRRRCLICGSLVVAAVCAIVFVARRDDSHSLEKIRAAVQPYMNAEAAKWNLSFSVGIVTKKGALSMAATRPGGVPLHPDALIPPGSATKTWTAAAVMKLVEIGKINLEDPAHHLIDPVMIRLDGTTMADFWGPRVNRITISQLLRMQGGIPDYLTVGGSWDTELVVKKNRGVSTFDWIRHSGPNLLSKPYYSSTNYALLGLALMGAMGHGAQ